MQNDDTKAKIGMTLEFGWKFRFEHQNKIVGIKKISQI